VNLLGRRKVKVRENETASQSLLLSNFAPSSCRILLCCYLLVDCVTVEFRHGRECGGGGDFVQFVSGGSVEA
jgi:hypothetical protein